MSRLTFEVDERTKRKFESAVKLAGENNKSILTILVRQYIEHGLVDTAELYRRLDQLEAEGNQLEKEIRQLKSGLEIDGE